MLHKSEFLPYAPDTRGEQVHVNHDGCHAGVDTKKRLYIKRTDDGAVLAWCHHCNEKGYHKDAVTNIHHRRRRVSSSIVDTVELPSDIELDVRMWPSHAKKWPLQYGIKISELEQTSFGYSPYLDRVIIPVYHNSKLVAWQGRSLDVTKNPPKYITRRHRDVPHPLFMSGLGHGEAPVVLVEDALSAIKVGRGAYGVACLGVYIDMPSLVELSGWSDTCIIALDNDNAQVRKEQMKIKCNAELVFKHVRIARLSKDPKAMSNKQLEDMIL